MPWSGGGLLFCLAFLVWANSYVILRQSGISKSTKSKLVEILEIGNRHANSKHFRTPNRRCVRPASDPGTAGCTAACSRGVGHVPDRAALALLRRAVARRCGCAGLAVLLRIALSRRDIRRRTWRDARSLGLLRQVSLANQAASRPRPREMSSPGGFDHHAATTNG